MITHRYGVLNVRQREYSDHVFDNVEFVLAHPHEVVVCERLENLHLNEDLKNNNSNNRRVEHAFRAVDFSLSAVWRLSNVAAEARGEAEYHANALSKSYSKP